MPRTLRQAGADYTHHAYDTDCTHNPSGCYNTAYNHRAR